MAAIFFQKRGTAIGTRMAPAYANLFMHHLESQLLNLAPVKPYLWLRYIDDIFMIWTAAITSRAVSYTHLTLPTKLEV